MSLRDRQGRYLPMPTVDDLADKLRDYAIELTDHDPKDIADDEGNPTGDVRLCMEENGDWQLRTGQVCYDTSTSDFCAAGVVPAGASREECSSIAEELLEELKDCIAWSA